MPRFRYAGGSAGDKFAVLTEQYLREKAYSNIDRKRYYYWQIYDITGLVGVILYVDITSSSATVHVHAPRCLTSRRTIRYMFDYPFNQLGVKKLFAPIHSMNENAQRNAVKLGFRLESAAKDYHNVGNDLLLFSCERGDIEKWIGEAQAEMAADNQIILAA